MTDLAETTLKEAARELLHTLQSWDTRLEAGLKRRRITVSSCSFVLIWGKSLIVQVGDSIYRYMAIISLCTEVLEIPYSDLQVQNPVKWTLQLLTEVSQEPINLLWPLLTAGACATSPEDRQWVRQLIDAFRGDCCRDIEIAVSHRHKAANRILTCLTIRKSYYWNNGPDSIARMALHLGPN